MLPVSQPIVNFTNRVLLLDGVLSALPNFTAWPFAGGRHANFLDFVWSSDFVITSSPGASPAMLDGRGYDWWWDVILSSNDTRPNLVQMTTCRNVTISSLVARNSPRFHFFLTDVLTVRIDNLTIWVDVEEQQRMLGSRGLLNSDGIPTFPLNTDGIDPAGRDIHITNTRITNFDDAVAVKPLAADGSNFYANCSEDMVIENSVVTFGVGMTIGSVPPHPGVNCVRNITFRSINFTAPIKGVYVKTNPGSSGTGLITDITYQDLVMDEPLWWGVYIGPQQQEQPGGYGPGCMLYPLDQECPTQPLVTVANITLRNVQVSAAMCASVAGVVAPAPARVALPRLCVCHPCADQRRPAVAGHPAVQRQQPVHRVRL